MEEIHVGPSHLSCSDKWTFWKAQN